MFLFEWLNKKKLERVLANEMDIREWIPMVLFEEAQIVMRNSKRIVPVDTGALRRSGTVLEPVRNNDTWTVTLGYGGAASAYALIQHERPDFKHAEGKSWKYLEIPFRESLPNLEARLMARLESKLRG